VRVPNKATKIAMPSQTFKPREEKKARAAGWWGEETRIFTKSKLRNV